MSSLREKKKGTTVKQFYRILKKLAENCDFENREEVIIREIFISNMLDDDIRRELLRDTVESERALRIVVNMEMGHRKPAMNIFQQQQRQQQRN